MGNSKSADGEPQAGEPRTKSSKGLAPAKSFKKANKFRTYSAPSSRLLTKAVDKQAQDSLKQDWAKVKGLPESEIDFNTTSVSLEEFKALMNPEMSTKDVEALFNLYDCDHNGSITWKEYIVVITLIMGGSTKEKIRLIFNCFDDDQNGSLSREEFITAALRFSPNAQNHQATSTYAKQVFAHCDRNGDGSISYKEFTAWITENPQEFEKFAGVLNILQQD